MNEWTPEIITTAAKMWGEGATGSAIADAIGTTRNSVLGMTHRNRVLFPHRVKTAKGGYQQSRTRAKGFAQTPRKQAIQRPPARSKPNPVQWIKPTPSAYHRGSAYDLDKYQIEGQTSARFDSLGAHQCRFILSQFGMKEGPESACCGADIFKRSYCRDHYRVVYTKRGSA